MNGCLPLPSQCISDSTKHGAYPFLKYSAFRIGETLLIQWKHVKLDLEQPENSYIFIPADNQKIAEKKGVEDRFASLRPELFYLIRDEMLPWKKKDDDLVFPFWSGSAQFYSRFKNLCYNANIPNFTVHDLRHDGVCWFFENTLLSDIEISKITGHIELSLLRSMQICDLTKWGLNFGLVC